MSEQDVVSKLLEELKKTEYGINNETQSKLNKRFRDIVADTPIVEQVVEKEQVPPNVNRDIRSNIRLYITDQPNSKGSNISGYDATVDADEYPFSSADEVSVFIKTLLGDSKNKVYVYTPSASKQIIRAKVGGEKRVHKRSTRKKRRYSERRKR
jgi:hypothetical protein